MSTAKLYDEKYHEDYDLLLKIPVYNRLIEKISELADAQEKDEIIILGVGTGNEAKKILEKTRVKRIVGVDNSQKMLEIAKEKNPSLEIINQNLEKFTSKKKFDKVISVRVIDHLENPEKGFQNINKLVKKNGEIIITLPLGADISRIWKESLKDIAKLLQKLRLGKIVQGIIAGVKTGKHSKKLLEQRKQNSNKTRKILNNIRKEYYIAYKKRVYGEQDILIKAVKK